MGRAFVDVWLGIRDEATKAWPNPTGLHFMMEQEVLRWVHWREERALMLLVEARLRQDGSVDVVAFEVIEIPESPADLP